MNIFKRLFKKESTDQELVDSLSNRPLITDSIGNPIPEGEYTTPDGRILKVKDGFIIDDGTTNNCDSRP